MTGCDVFEIPADRDRALERYRTEPAFHDAVDMTAIASSYSRSQLLDRQGPARLVVE